MDLLQTVRKEGSRGGRSEFKWNDVKDSQHRENYLGHSLMAPVGRWQKNRDLNWYAKDGSEPQSEADARKEELKLVKRAEEEAMAKALGYELPPKPEDNANMTKLGQRPGESIGDERAITPTKSRDKQEARSRHHRDRRGERQKDDRHGRRHRSRSRSRDRDTRRERDRRDRSDKPGCHDSHSHRSRFRDRRSNSPERQRDGRRSNDSNDKRRGYDYEARRRDDHRRRSRSPRERRPSRD